MGDSMNMLPRRLNFDRSHGSKAGHTWWIRGLRIGRIQVRVTLLRHHYSAGISDRWVLQTSTAYDRKDRT